MALKLINRNKGKEVDRVALFDKFIEDASECFFMFDKNLFAITMNEAAAKMNGIKNVKKTGADIKELLPNMYNTNRFDQFRDVIRTEKPLRFRDYIYRDDETPKLYEISAFKLGSGLGVIALDLTKRDLKSEELKNNDQFNAAIQAVIHNPFLILDNQNRVLRANKAFYDHFFLRSQDVVNQSVFTLNETQWNIHELHELLEYKLSTAGSAKNYEIKGYFTGLGDRTLKLNAKQYDLVEENRKVTLLAINDITEIAKQRDNLKKLTTIYQDSPDAVVVTDTRGQIIEMNGEAIKLYEWAESELLQKSFQTILAPEVRDGYKTMLEGVLNGTPVTEIETSHWTKKGEVLPIIMSMRVVLDQADKPVGTVAFMKAVRTLKLAETALAQLQEILIQSNDPVVITDLDGKITDFNPAAERAFSRQKESTVGKEGNILVPADEQDAYQAAFASCLEGKEGRLIDINCITRQEVTRKTQLSFNLIMDARNEPVAMSVVERHKSAKDKAESAYSHLLETFLEIPEPVVVENMSSEVVDLNRAAASFYGWKKSDLIGKASKLLIPTDQHARNKELFEMCRNGEFIRDEKSTRWSKNGKFYNINLTMFMILNTNEEPEYVISIAKPLDGFARIPGQQAALKMDALYEDSQDAIIIEDLQGNVIQMNPAAENLLGWKTREIAGKPMINIIPGDKHQLHEKILLLIQNDVPIKRVESKLWSKRGEVFPVAVSLILMKDAEGNPQAVACINQDLNLTKGTATEGQAQ